ncbi:Arm DNA-binding domain-containing protein [Sphingomonas gei]|uniref:Arm DNA-binding domain-containing protein n=1 Tax=Sphingomonas gei TaxID=1395960 RepID=UPI001F0F50AD|nr:Arm DNA-binding domain-containing protein [Sphingomonas gei]
MSDANRLFLLVTPSGGKLWRYGYYYDGKQKTLTFGAYPLISLSEARVKRDEAAGLLAEGHDPNLVRKLRINATIEAARLTFEKVAREWH